MIYNVTIRIILFKKNLFILFLIYYKKKNYLCRRKILSVKTMREISNDIIIYPNGNEKKITKIKILIIVY